MTAPPMAHNFFRRIVWILLLLTVSTHPLAAPQVLVSIKPIHSLVSSVMQGVGKPQLLIQASQSPHAFSLRPSDVRKLEAAELILWVGEDFETPLSRLISTLSTRTRVLSLLDHPRLHRLHSRRSGNWEFNPNPSTMESHHHHHHGLDPHIWLSPDNARVIVEIVKDQLVEIDPDHQSEYQINAESTLVKLTRLDAALRQSLSKVKDIPYLVFHDAYQYFEQAYELNALGSVVLSPDRQPGLKHIREVQEKIQEQQIQCIFREPQFQPRLLDELTRQTSIRIGILDPIGADLPKGPDSYFQLLRNLADNLVACLAEDASVQ